MVEFRPPAKSSCQAAPSRYFVLFVVHSSVETKRWVYLVVRNRVAVDIAIRQTYEGKPKEQPSVFHVKRTVLPRMYFLPVL